MNIFLWAGLALNALVHLRIAVLEVQDGEDRVRAGKRDVAGIWCWEDGSGVFLVTCRTAMSPLLTIYKVGKFLLFPRGIKSKFAKEQEAKAAAEVFAKRTSEAEALIQAWAPGQMLVAAPRPEQLALTWDHAADVFDAAADLVARTKGQPWQPSDPGKRIKAMVGES